MRPICLAIVACAFTLPLPSAAQSGATAANAGAGAEKIGQVTAQDQSPSAAEQPVPEKKKGGLFGKVKRLTKNKVVQQVAKTAACTMVPGGQVIAGAIDAASSKSAGEAAAGAVGAATGSNCMGGGGLGAAGAATGLAGAAVQAGAGGSTLGAALGGLSPGMPLGGTGYGAIAGTPSPEKLAKCLGLSPKEFQDLTDPTHSQPHTLTDDEMKRQAELAQKLDMRRYQACLMQH
jgi:hypothetical protein